MTALFPDDFVMSLPEDYDEAIIATVDRLVGTDERSYESMQQAAALILALAKARNQPAPSISPETKLAFLGKQLNDVRAAAERRIETRGHAATMNRFGVLLGGA